MRTHLFAAALAALFAAATAAQEPKADPKKADPPAAAPSEAEKAFADAVRGAEKALRGAKAYTVKAECRWKLTGGAAEQSGVNRVAMTARHPGRFHIELSAPENPDARFVVASDGAAITRLFAAARLYSVTPTTSPLADVQLDGLTVASLQSAGVDFLVHTDVSGVVTAQTVRVADLGEKESGGRKLHCFGLHLANERDVEVRFAAGERPLPVELVVTTTLPLDEKRKLTKTLDTKLTWDLDADPAAGAFAVALPEGARKVDDLTEEVLGQGVKDLLGKPAPEVTFAALDGAAVSPAAQKEKSAVVLFFWASWAAPSAAEMPTIQKFIDEYGGKGVTFLAVNVGEAADEVKEFVGKVGYKGTVVRDPKGEGMAELRAGVPTAVLIGKDGTVQAVVRGLKPEAREQIRKGVDALLAGKPLAPKD
jgi:thiol-disulfide isomerase/thioredoxin